MFTKLKLCGMLVLFLTKEASEMSPIIICDYAINFEEVTTIKYFLYS